MTTRQQIEALVTSHIDGDDRRFRALALQVAAGLKDGSVIKNKLSEPSKLVDSTVIGSVFASTPDISLSNIVFERDSVALRLLQDILAERRGQQKLAEHGFEPCKSILLHGPSGTGKTMTATALSRELNMTLYTVPIHGVVDSYLGATSSKLAKVFESMTRYPGVYLFDEVDALGASRATEGKDVGEARRIVNTLLTLIDQLTSKSLFIAATNLPELLDTALTRRIDYVVPYTLPSEEAIVRILEKTLGTADWSKFGGKFLGFSHATVVTLAKTAAKKAILTDSAIEL